MLLDNLNSDDRVIPFDTTHVRRQGKTVFFFYGSRRIKQRTVDSVNRAKATIRYVLSQGYAYKA